MEIAILLATMIGSLSTAVGIFYLAKQLKDNRRTVTAEFISDLESEFSTLSEVYYNLLPGGIWSASGTGPIGLKELSKIIFYLSFFGKIEYLINLKVLDFPTIDQLFAFRFFLVTNNIHTQEKVLYSSMYQNYWLDVYRLHRRWTLYRRERGFEIPFENEAMLKYEALENMERHIAKS
jgi:hypothetical protein